MPKRYPYPKAWLCAPMEHGARQKIVKRHSSIVDHCLVFHSVHVVQNACVWSCARIIPVFFVGSRHFSYSEPFRPPPTLTQHLFLGFYFAFVAATPVSLVQINCNVRTPHGKTGKLHLSFLGNISASMQLTPEVYAHRHITPTEIATSDSKELNGNLDRCPRAKCVRLNGCA